MGQSLFTPTTLKPKYLRGGDRGSGSHWLYDGGALVRKSILLGTPIIFVSFKYVELSSYRHSFDIRFSFRIGLFGFAASPMIHEDNKIMGDQGVGNYGLRDQRECLDWLHHYISDFGGDPLNITLAGHSTIHPTPPSPTLTHPIPHTLPPPPTLIRTHVQPRAVPHVRLLEVAGHPHGLVVVGGDDVAAPGRRFNAE